MERIKLEGNNLYKQKSYRNASQKYLEAILEAESFRKEKQDFLELHSMKDDKLKLDKIEIDCRNNYCSVKKILKENDFIVDHCQKILDIDKKNTKANFNLAFYNFDQEKFADARTYINIALERSSSKQIIDLQKKINLKIEGKDKSVQEELKNEENEVKDYEKYFEEDSKKEKEISQKNDMKTEEKTEEKEISEEEEIKDDKTNNS